MLFLNLKLKYIITSLRSLLLKSVAVFINFDSWVLSSKPRNVKQYVDWISEFADYCHREGLNNIHDGQSVKLFLFVYRHDTSKVAKRSNERQRSKILSRRRLESSTVSFNYYQALHSL